MSFSRQRKEREQSWPQRWRTPGRNFLKLSQCEADALGTIFLIGTSEDTEVNHIPSHVSGYHIAEFTLHSVSLMTISAFAGTKAERQGVEGCSISRQGQEEDKEPVAWAKREEAIIDAASQLTRCISARLQLLL